MVREEKVVAMKDERVVTEEEEEEVMVKKEASAVSAPSTLDTQLLLNMISQQQSEIAALDRYVWIANTCTLLVSTHT